MKSLPDVVSECEKIEKYKASPQFNEDLISMFLPYLERGLTMCSVVLRVVKFLGLLWLYWLSRASTTSELVRRDHSKVPFPEDMLEYIKAKDEAANNSLWVLPPILSNNVKALVTAQEDAELRVKLGKIMML